MTDIKTAIDLANNAYFIDVAPDGSHTFKGTAIAAKGIAKSTGAAVKHLGGDKYVARPKAGSLKAKTIVVLDTGDGAFTDASIKVKPHKSNPSLVVLKCTDRARLVKALKDSGVKVVRVTKGSKHWIAVVPHLDVAAALAAPPAPPSFPKPAPKALKAKG